MGYDFGLLLYNLAYLDDPLKEEVLKVMLDIVDGTGAWVEYYDNRFRSTADLDLGKVV